MLRIENVSKRFGRGARERVALDNVSLEISRGELVGLFGPTGAGKTTLLRVAAGLLRPDSGAVVYKGGRLDRMSAGERARVRRQEVACIWASEEPWEKLRVLDHVMMPLLMDHRDRNSAERRAREALLACEAEPYAELDLHELSEGEWQRVELAAALAREPWLLLADRPASRLPLEERERVMKLLAATAHEGRAAVLIADSSAEAFVGADRILFMREGELVAPADDPAALAKVYPLSSARLRLAAGDA